MRIKSATLTFLLLLFCSALSGAQSRPHRPTSQVDQNPQPDVNDPTGRMAHDMAKKANEERAAALKNDADRLLKLALELKTYVDKSNENVLSLDVIKKAEEIEKLAHSVKDKMKGPN